MKLKTFIYSLILFSLTSCSFLDVPSETTWGDGTFPTNAQHIESLLYGGYDDLQSALGKDFVMYGETRADNYVLTKHFDSWDKILHNGINYTTGGCSWAHFYDVVQQANLVIANIDKINEIDKMDNYSSILGQAYCMRAFTYFWMVRIWGGVPLITEPYMDGHQLRTYARATEEEVIAQIYSDLENAGNLLPENHYEKTTFSYTAVLAIRAQVAAWEHNWDGVIENADKVLGGSRISVATPINNPNYKLCSLYDPSIDKLSKDFITKVVPELPYCKMFNDQKSSESIFELAFHYGDKEDNLGLFGMFSYTNFPLKPSPTALTLFSEDDWRYFINFYDQGGLKALKQLINYDRYSTAHSIVLLRVAETALLKAEALLYRHESIEEARTSGDVDMAMAIVNAIRMRAGGEAMLYTSADYETLNLDELKEIVAFERRAELYCEGHRYFDLYRTGKLIEVMQPINGQSLESSFYWPIHMDEIVRSNGKIEQNEYYK